jgi:hypothetical protein
LTDWWNSPRLLLYTDVLFPDALSGYTHQRLLTATITTANWPRVMQELIRVTRPGDWVERVEIDNQIVWKP